MRSYPASCIAQHTVPNRANRILFTPISVSRPIRYSHIFSIVCIYHVMFGSTKKQHSVALSSSEAEYVAPTKAACHVVWMRRIPHDLKEKQAGPTTLYCDNKSSIAMTRNPVFHGRTKHIELRHHYIRELVAKGEVKLEFCSTDDEIADIFTKALSTEKFYKLALNWMLCMFELKGDMLEINSNSA